MPKLKEASLVTVLLSIVNVFAFHVIRLSILLPFLLFSGCQSLREAQMLRQKKIKQQMIQKISRLNKISPDYFWAEEEIHKSVNQYRVSLGLNPLTLNAEISEVAREHSNNMANVIVPFGHQGFRERVQQIRTTFSAVSSAENVAWNFSSLEPCYVAFRGWVNSPGHQKNMVGDFNLTGIGVELGDNGSYYFTQIFIRTP